MDFSGHSVSSVAVLDAANDAAQQALFLIGIAADSRFSVVYYIGQKYTMQEYSAYFLDYSGMPRIDPDQAPAWCAGFPGKVQRV
jgi:hypothetical protein